MYRLWAAVGLGILLSLLIEALVGRVTIDTGATAASDARFVLEIDFAGQLIAWCGFATVYLGLGFRAYVGCDRAELVRRIRGTPLPHGRLRRLLLAGGGPVGFPILVAVWAFATVAAVVASNVGGDAQPTRPLELVFAAFTIVTCIVMIAFCFALHYARKDIEEGGLEFLGPDEPTFSDYAYLSVGCSATLGVTDTMAVSSSMRRTLTVQTIISWAINTVVIAVLISVILQ